MELLKLLLVDDEAIILKGFQTTYDWERMGFQVIGTAMSGEKALALLEDEEPDVVLTDVRMKKISGLDLIQMAKSTYPHMKFVIISAHKDFEYAKKACEYGAIAYLLKPVEDEELETVMEKAYELCITEKKQRLEHSNWRRILLDDREGFLSHMIEKYVNNIICEEELVQLFESLDIGYESHFAAVCLDLDAAYGVTNRKEYVTKRERLFLRAEQGLGENYKIWNYKNKDGSRTFIVELGEKSHSMDIKFFLELLQKEMKQEMVSAVSNVYKGLGGMKTAYQQVSKLYEVVCETGGSLLTGGGVGAETASGMQYSIELENAILSAVRKNDEERLKKEFVQLLYHFPSKEETGKIYLRCLAVRTEVMLDDSYGMSENVRGGFGNFYQILERYPLVRLVDIFYKLMVTVMEERRSLPTEAAEEYFSDYIKVAMDYIHDHLSEEELSITMVSAQIYLNPVYFGRVFKNIVGISFKRYVMNERMERAKQMILKGTESIGDICTRVGMYNPSYFTQIFKQSTGMLPSEYKREFLS